MDQASASQAASCVRNPAAPRTSSSCSRSVGRSRTAVPPPARSGPQSGPHSEPVHIAPRSSSPALRRFEAKGHPLPDFYSGATGIPGRFSEGLLLRRSHFILLIGGFVGLRHGLLASTDRRAEDQTSSSLKLSASIAFKEASRNVAENVPRLIL